MHAASRLRRVGLALMLATPLAAQAPVRALPQRETRLDAVVTPGGGVLAGVGVNRRFGWYARGGATLSVGAVRAGDGWAAMQRVEVVSRFLFDPFGEHRRGVYGGAGVAVRHLAGDVTRPELVLVAGVEGPRVGSEPIPSVEVSLGGGLRIGMVLRRQRPVGR
ncbi:MAG: hypothetical protein P3A32_02800 [Gemmatimonadota bacterium]|nr:hypothetical protein [Gemmatimonadota bacterium]MDQ8147016.1 hypothetical protein [Gemmatimonadota bacterium]MDQ8148739.1 hypothetical protein [Gemmatimonadota bacterium]MDQ8176431.1 hypothetical protein [Gemmatimonadota bacterium]